MTTSAALQAWIDNDNETLPYRFVPESRAILFHHMDLMESWWNRGKSRDEAKMQKLESLIQGVTGLQRLTRIHRHPWNIVEFRLSKKYYKAAAVALRMTYRPDPFSERCFDRYLKTANAR